MLLGCGKMGGALIEGWLRSGLPLAALTVLEPDPAPPIAALAARGLRLNAEVAPGAAAAVVAVKPQVIDAALSRLAPLGGGGTLILSIAAGIPLARLEAAFAPGTPVVRAMPNTPAAIGRGITALVGNAAADASRLATAEALMAAVGAVVRLEREADMDAVTAVSGSGPAYLFLMIEALAAAGEAEGLEPALALRLARATVAGAARLAEAADAPPEDLRRNVTSPGGTTAAALASLTDPEAGLPALMRRAVAAAAARSRELAR